MLAWCNINRPEGGVQACCTFHRHCETSMARMHCRPFSPGLFGLTHDGVQTRIQGAVQLLLKQLLPSAQWRAHQQQPCAQMLVAAGHATHACRTVLLLCAKCRDTQLTKHEIQASNAGHRQAGMDVHHSMLSSVTADAHILKEQAKNRQIAVMGCDCSIACQS